MTAVRCEGSLRAGGPAVVLTSEQNVRKGASFSSRVGLEVRAGDSLLWADDVAEPSAAYLTPGSAFLDFDDLHRKLFNLLLFAVALMLLLMLIGTSRKSADAA
jgi:hypothetical protein